MLARRGLWKELWKKGKGGWPFVLTGRRIAEETSGISRFTSPLRGVGRVFNSWYYCFVSNISILIQFFFFFSYNRMYRSVKYRKLGSMRSSNKISSKNYNFHHHIRFLFSMAIFKNFLNKLKVISRKWDGRDNCINEISNNFEKINEIRNMRRWKQRAKSITEGDEKWWRWKGIKWNKKGK